MNRFSSYSLQPQAVPIPFHRLLKVVAVVDAANAQTKELLAQIAAEGYEVELAAAPDRDLALLERLLGLQNRFLALELRLLANGLRLAARLGQHALGCFSVRSRLSVSLPPPQDVQQGPHPGADHQDGDDHPQVFHGAVQPPRCAGTRGPQSSMSPPRAR